MSFPSGGTGVLIFLRTCMWPLMLAQCVSQRGVSPSHPAELGPPPRPPSLRIHPHASPPCAWPRRLTGLDGPWLLCLPAGLFQGKPPQDLGAGGSEVRFWFPSVLPGGIFCPDGWKATPPFRAASAPSSLCLVSCGGCKKSPQIW